MPSVPTGYILLDARMLFAVNIKSWSKSVGFAQTSALIDCRYKSAALSLVTEYANIVNSLLLPIMSVLLIFNVAVGVNRRFVSISSFAPTSSLVEGRRILLAESDALNPP